MNIFEPVYTIRLVYKSGYAIDFDVLKYTVDMTRISWTEPKSNQQRPLKMNYDDVSSVWLVKTRYRLKRFWKRG